MMKGSYRMVNLLLIGKSQSLAFHIIGDHKALLEANLDLYMNEC